MRQVKSEKTNGIGSEQADNEKKIGSVVNI